MSSAVNLYLRQCVLRGELPFSVDLPQYNDKTISAIAEARRISRDPNVRGYDNVEGLMAALDD